MGSTQLRVFPKDVFFVKGSWLHGTQILSGYPLRGGIGFTLGPAGYMETGVGMRFPYFDLGIYIEPHFEFEIAGYPIEVVPEFTFLTSPRQNHSASFLIGISVPLEE